MLLKGAVINTSNNIPWFITGNLSQSVLNVTGVSLVNSFTTVVVF